MSILKSPFGRIVGINLFLMIALQSTYFVGIIGCATYDLGAGALEVSALTFSLNTLLVLGNLASGPVIDWIGPRKTLLVLLAATALTGAFEWLSPVSYPSLFIAAMANGFFFGAATTAVDAYPRFFSEDAHELSRTNSLSQVATGISVILGPALAAWICTWAPNRCVFSIMTVAPFPALALAWVTREEKPVGKQVHAQKNARLAKGEGQSAVAEKPGFFHEVLEGVKIVLTKDELRILFIISFLGFLPTGPSTRWSLCSTETCCASTPIGWGGCPRHLASAARWGRFSSLSSTTRSFLPGFCRWSWCWWVLVR